MVEAELEVCMRSVGGQTTHAPISEDSFIAQALYRPPCIIYAPKEDKNCIGRESNPGLADILSSWI